jgi:methylsterol monooxygenase
VPRLTDHASDLLLVVGWLVALRIDNGRWWGRLWEQLAPLWSGSTVGDAVGVVVLAFGWYLFVFWSWGLLFLWLDHARPAWADRHRLQRPADLAVVDVDDVKPGVAVVVVLANQFFLTLPALCALAPVLIARSGDVRGPPPPWWVALFVVVAAFSWVELSFYVIHRAMHAPWLYRRFHHVHHRYRRPAGIATHYLHPVDHVLGNLVPVLGGAVIATVHPSTLLLWITLAVRNAIFTHGNHSLPLLGEATHHDLHHHDPRVHFGVVGILDHLCGTTGRTVRAPAPKTPSSSMSP